MNSIHQGYLLAEAHKQIPEGTAGKFTVATILEAGVQAAHRAYYGDPIFSKIMAEKRANHEGLQLAGNIQEALLSDVSGLFKVTESHVSSDFPLVLANIRDRVVRKEFNPYESAIFGVATERDVKDFKQIKGIKYGNIDRLEKRPERTDVTMVTFEQTEDGYSVCNYEKGVSYTWESYVNDDLSVFTNGLIALGIAAKRNRALVVLEAMLSINRETIGGNGGPENARIRAARAALAAIKDNDNNSLGLRGDNIIIPTQWEDTAAEALESDRLYQADGKGDKNILKGRVTTQVEKLMARVFGDDWFIYDGDVKFLEIAYLEGFRAGPKTYTQMPDVKGDLANEGSFKSHEFAVKLGDALAAKVVESRAIKRVRGN